MILKVVNTGIFTIQYQLVSRIFSINKTSLAPAPCQKLPHPKPSHIVSASHPRHNAPFRRQAANRSWTPQERWFLMHFLGVEITRDFWIKFRETPNVSKKNVWKDEIFCWKQEILSPWIYPFSQGFQKNNEFAPVYQKETNRIFRNSFRYKLFSVSRS